MNNVSCRPPPFCTWTFLTGQHRTEELNSARHAFKLTFYAILVRRKDTKKRDDFKFFLFQILPPLSPSGPAPPLAAGDLRRRADLDPGGRVLVLPLRLAPGRAKLLLWFRRRGDRFLGNGLACDGGRGEGRFGKAGGSAFVGQELTSPVSCNSR